MIDGASPVIFKEVVMAYNVSLSDLEVNHDDFCELLADDCISDIAISHDLLNNNDTIGIKKKFSIIRFFHS